MMQDMSPAKIRDFCYGIIREETFVDYRVFSKAVRVTLLELGFTIDFVENEFRPVLDEIYEYAMSFRE